MFFLPISVVHHGTKFSENMVSSCVASFTNKVNPRLAKRPLKTNGRLVNLELTSLVKRPLTCKRFPHDWPFVRGNPTVCVVFLYKGPMMWSFAVLFVIIFNKLLNKQLSCRSSDTLVGQIHAKTKKSPNDLNPLPSHNDTQGQWGDPEEYAWWRHQMETFSALLALCAGNSPVTGEFPTQRPVTRSFDVFFDLRLDKRLSKQWLDWWF